MNNDLQNPFQESPQSIQSHQPLPIQRSFSNAPSERYSSQSRKLHKNAKKKPNPDIISDYYDEYGEYLKESSEPFNNGNSNDSHIFIF